MQNTELQEQVEQSRCYLRFRVQCAEQIELQLMAGDFYSDPVFVKATTGREATFTCIPALCTSEGITAEDAIVIGNNITVEPEITVGLPAYTSKEECDMAGDEEYTSNIACTKDSIQVKKQG